MPFNKSRLFGVIILLCCIPGTMWASNWQWLKDSPVMSFDEKDWKLLNNAIDQMLNEGADGDRRQWQNPQTGNSGSVQVVDTSNTDTGTCRNLVISNNSKPENGVTRLNFCQQQDGQWKVDNRTRKIRQ